MSKDFWNDVFSDADYVYGKQENDFISKAAGHIPPQADVACFAEGEGRNAVYLAGQGHRVTSYDQSDVALEKTKELAAEHNVEVSVKAADLTTDKVEVGVYDAAVMVFGHVPKESQPFLWRNVAESVKPGGYIIVEVYSDDQLAYGTGGPPALDMLYSPEDILHWTKNDHCLHFYYGEAERNEGKKHHGRCHVIQVMVQKKNE